MYNIILLLHVLGGLGVFLSGSYFIYASFKNILENAKRKILFLSGLTLFQTATGVVLYLMSFQSSSIGVVCGKISLYIAFTTLTAAIVYKNSMERETEI